MLGGSVPDWNSVELYTACEILREYGWIQGKFRTDDGMCVLEALYEAYARLETDYTRRERVNCVVRDSLPVTDRNKGLTTWNDTFGRTFPDVIALLREADQNILQ